ncbi:unnamed protein product [Mucor hiemalis]
MYNVPINNRIIRKPILSTQQARLMSTNNVRKGGFSKLLLGTLFVSAAGIAYFQTSSRDKYFYEGDSDPYAKTKKNVSELGHEIAQDGSVRRESQGALDELDSAGKHVKKSAQLAGQAAKDAFSHVEKEGSQAVGNFKDESRKLKDNVRSDADKFLSEHHLKEGDHSPEYVLSHNHSDPNQAAYKAANKFKEAKENASNELNKETQKAKKAWEETTNEAKAKAEHVKEEGKSFWSSIFGESKKEDVVVAAQDGRKPAVPQKNNYSFDYPETKGEGNPMVLEKLNKNKTKPEWETSLEEHAQNVVHDTSTLVTKDTEKVKKGVWDARDKAGRSEVAQETSLWTSIFGKAEDKASELETKAANELHERSEEAKSKWESLKNKVGVTAHDVKKDAENSWENVKDKANTEAQRAKSNVDSTVNDLSHEAKKESSRLESGWNNVKKQVNDDAEHALHSVEDAAHKVSNKFKSESNKVASDINKTTQDVKDEGSRLTRKASDSINDLHSEVSANAEQWKKQGEQTAKSWYQKGTEQVKEGFENVKNVADKDLQWAESKVQDTYTDAKDEVSRLFGLRNDKEAGVKGHVFRGERFAEEEAGHLRGTRNNVDLKPAEVVVEEAHNKNF